MRRTRAEEIAKQAALNAELLGAMNSHGNAVVSKNHVAVVTQDGKPGCWLTLLRDYSGGWSVLSASGAIDAVIPPVRARIRDAGWLRTRFLSRMRLADPQPDGAELERCRSASAVLSSVRHPACHPG